MGGMNGNEGRLRSRAAAEGRGKERWRRKRGAWWEKEWGDGVDRVRKLGWREEMDGGRRWMDWGMEMSSRWDDALRTLSWLA